MLFIRSCLLGFIVAIPVGPVALLILQRSLTVGRIAGLFTGLGAALADGLFGFLAALGLVALIEQLEGGRFFWRPLGSLGLIFMGLYFFFHNPPSLNADEVLSGRYQRRYWWDTISSFFLTLLNPTTIIAFAALFAGSDLIPEDPRKIQYIEIATGVFAGSLLWWLLLVSMAAQVKMTLNPERVHRVLQGIGGVLIALGMISIIPRAEQVWDRLRSFL